MSDPYSLERFVKAQDRVYEQVRQELKAGDKRSHWMWFVFPQIEGLGHSATAKEFAISGVGEAAAYLSHPILGPRLIECTRLLSSTTGRTAAEIFGYPDDLKLRSSMTLFAHAAPENRLFRDILDQYFDGDGDPLTMEKLHNASS